MPKSLLTLVAAVLAVAVLPASAWAADRSAESRAAWDHVSAARRAPAPATPQVRPRRFAAFTLDQDALAQVLDEAPAARRTANRLTLPADGLEVSVPDPAGGFTRFTVVEAPVMAPALAAAHPEIRTYAGRGVADPSASIRLDVGPNGFHASVRGRDGDGWYVDPRYADGSEYAAYARDAITSTAPTVFTPDGPDTVGGPAGRAGAAQRPANGALVTLRTYRLALVSDPTYATAVGDVTAAKATLMSRVNQIYEQDLAIHMDLIAGNDALNLSTTAAATGTNGPCGSGACYTTAQLAACGTALLARNDLVASRLAGGSGKYDLAHIILGTNGGGIAGLGVVGDAFKAEGCTGIPNPTGDAFAVDYVAHEMGHQFGGQHTFNGNGVVDDTQPGYNCGPDNRAAAVSVEPGSGTSIMAYAGICGQDDLQPHSDPYFSQASVDQISAYTSQAEVNRNAQQQAVMTSFDGTDSFTLTYGGQTSATITRGTNYTSAAVKAAIQAIPGWPAGATVTITSLSSSGFTVQFGGSLAGQAVSLLAFGATNGFTGFVGESVTGGASRRGGTAQVTANHAPSVATPAGYTIPARTPFLVNATGSDSDGDPLTYMWEQDDVGAGSAGIPLVSNAKTSGPLFRIFGTAARYSDAAAHQSPSPGENLATGQTWRAFPDPLQVAADNTNAASGTCPAAPAGGAVPVATVDCYSEYLPTSAWIGADGTRTLHFRVTARDDHTGAGGTGIADTALTVAPAAGPFRVTSQASASSSTTGATLPVTWNVASTDVSPVSTSQVTILLSTDGGATFPYTLKSGTANDGSESVLLPRVTTTQGRIKVAADGNVFYDMSKANLTITTTDPVLMQAPASVDLGNAGVGGEGADKIVTFTNAGTGTAHPTTLTVGGPDAGAVFVASEACTGTALASGASCVAVVRLRPSHLGPHDATLTLTTPDDDASATTKTVALTGNGQTAPSVFAPGLADLGSAAVGGQGGDVAVTFTNQGSGGATLGTATLGGPDAGAVVVRADGCSRQALAIGASCAITLRLAPTRVGAQNATLTLPSDDPASPRAVALTGTATAAIVTPPPVDTPPGPPAPGPAPTPLAPTPIAPPTPVTPVSPSAVAAALLGTKAPVAAGSAGALRLFTPTRSTKLGKPKASKVIAAAVCSGGACAGKATAKLTLTPKAKGKKKKAYTLTISRALKLADGQGARLTLKLSATYRKRIKAARRATLALTVTNGTKKVTKTFTLTTG